MSEAKGVATVKSIIRATFAEPERGTVCLIGPTQTGKSYLASEVLAEAGAAEVVRYYLQADPPEEITGLPFRDAEYAAYTAPPGIPRHLLNQPTGWGIFLDELDKARDESLAVILRLLGISAGERALRSFAVPKTVPIICAANPRMIPWPEPLLARLLFVRWPVDDTIYSEREVFRKWPRMLSLVKDAEIPLPERPATVGNIHRLSHWLTLPEFWQNDQMRSLLIDGLFPANQVPAVHEILRTEVLSSPLDWIQHVAPGECAERVVLMLNRCAISPDSQLYPFMETLRTRGEADPTGELTRIFTTLSQMIEVPANFGEPEEKIQEVQAAFLKKLNPNEAAVARKETPRASKKKA